MVREALRLLERQEIQRRQLKAKLNHRAARAEHGDLLGGDAVFAELRDLIEERRRAREEKVKV